MPEGQCESSRLDLSLDWHDTDCELSLREDTLFDFDLFHPALTFYVVHFTTEARCAAQEPNLNINS